VIPNFTTLDEALAQTSADGPNGHRRADGAPEGSQENKLVAQYAISELDEEKLMAVASVSVGIPDRAISSGADSCAFSGLRHAWGTGLGDGCSRSGRRRERGS